MESILLDKSFYNMPYEQKRFLANNEGIMLLFDKPKEYTSARIVNIVKKFLDVNKAGHSGTLDPKATGLIIVCTAKKTKLLNSLLQLDKLYEGIMIMGQKTKSYDTETIVYETKDISFLNYDLLKSTAEEFTGKIKQIPPMYSAVKYEGKPLYKLARKGMEVNREPKTVIIKEFAIEQFSGNELNFRVLCSKGTYIRSLVHDFGEKLQTGAYLKELRRLRIGEYDVKNSITPDEFIKQCSKKIN